MKHAVYFSDKDQGQDIHMASLIYCCSMLLAQISLYLMLLTPACAHILK